MKKVLLSLLCLAGSMMASAETVTWVPSEQGYENAEEITTVTVNDVITLTFDKGTNNNTPKYYNTGSAVRLYGGNTLTVTANGATISEVVFTASTSNPIVETSTVTSGYLTTEGTETTWTGSAPGFMLTEGGTTGHARISKIEITYAAGGEIAVAAPKFNPAAGEIAAGTAVSITTSTPGATIYYAIDSDPIAAGTEYTEPIVINQSSVIRAVAVKDGVSSSISEAAYTIKATAATVDNIAAWLEMAETNDYVAIGNPVTVVIQGGQRLFVQDASGSLLIYGNVNKTYNPGDRIPAGLAGKYTVYNGIIEFVPDADTFQEGVAGAAPESKVTTIDNIVSGAVAQSTYVELQGVAVNTADKLISQDGVSLPYYNQFNITLNDAEDVTLRGIVTVYNGNVQLYPTEVVGDTPEPPIPAEEVTDIAAWLAAGNTTDNITIANAVTAVYQHGKSLYVKDNTAWLLVFGDLGKTYNNGDVIPAGISGKYVDYNGLPEMTPAADSFGQATPGTAVEPTLTMIGDVNAEPLNSYIELQGVTIGAAQGKTIPVSDFNEDTINLYNTFGIDVPEGEGYTVRGFVAVYNGTYQIYPVEVFNPSQANRVGTPTFSVAAGDVLEGTEVALSCPTAGAAIHYTLNGGDPTAESPVYSEPIVINENTVIRAIAVKEGMDNSEVAVAEYTIVNVIPGDKVVYFVAAQYENEFDNVVVLHNNGGNDEPSADDAKEEELTLNGLTFDSEYASISFEHGTGNYYATVFGEEVRFYNGETMVVTPAEGYKVVEMYFNTASGSKGNVSVTSDGQNVGVVTGSGEGAANPITWVGESANAMDVYANKQVRFNYLRISAVSITGIESVGTDSEAPAEYYNLQGIRVINPTAGNIYIKRQGNTASKVLVK